MLEELLLRNFQRHQRYVLRFDPAMTVLTGMSDAGKSTIIRALCWLMFNRPAGDRFMRRGAKFVAVTLKVDGHTITRRKGKKGNQYVVDGGDPCNAVNQEVPPAVAALLNVDAINIQRQLDGPWWFDKTAGQVSHELNDIVNLGGIDATLTTLAAQLRLARSTSAVTENRLATALAGERRFGWVPAAQAAWAEVQQTRAAVVGQRAKIARLDTLLATYENGHRGAQRAATLLPLATAARQAADAAQTAHDRLDRLTELLRQYRAAEDDQCRLTAELDQLTARRKKALASGCPLCGKTTKVSSTLSP